LNLGPSDL